MSVLAVATATPAITPSESELICRLPEMLRSDRSTKARVSFEITLTATAPDADADCKSLESFLDGASSPGFESGAGVLVSFAASALTTDWDVAVLMTSDPTPVRFSAETLTSFAEVTKTAWMLASVVSTMTFTETEPEIARSGIFFFILAAVLSFFAEAVFASSLPGSVALSSALGSSDLGFSGSASSALLPSVPGEGLAFALGFFLKRPVILFLIGVRIFSLTLALALSACDFQPSDFCAAEPRTTEAIQPPFTASTERLPPAEIFTVASLSVLYSPRRAFVSRVMTLTAADRLAVPIEPEMSLLVMFTTQVLSPADIVRSLPAETVAPLAM